MSLAWAVERARDTAAALHHRAFGPDVARTVWLLDVARPALVLGSAQPEDDADRDALAGLGVDLVRRRSGGGAVLLVPGRSTWVDVDIPRGDPLWHDDVGRAFHWLGEAWVAALARLGVDASVHRGPMVATPWSATVCFAGLGPGEVRVGARKLVGISQRRTRAGARFQCVLHRSWDPAAILAVLALDGGGRVAARDDLADVAAGLDVDGQAVLDALVAVLPAG